MIYAEYPHPQPRTPCGCAYFTQCCLLYTVWICTPYTQCFFSAVTHQWAYQDWCVVQRLARRHFGKQKDRWSNHNLPITAASYVSPSVMMDSWTISEGNEKDSQCVQRLGDAADVCYAHRREFSPRGRFLCSQSVVCSILPSSFSCASAHFQP